MQPRGFKTRLASARNLGWSNQWTAEAAVSKSTDPSGNGSSSAFPSLWVQGTLVKKTLVKTSSGSLSGAEVRFYWQSVFKSSNEALQPV